MAVVTHNSSQDNQWVLSLAACPSLCLPVPSSVCSSRAQVKDLGWLGLGRSTTLAIPLTHTHAHTERKRQRPVTPSYNFRHFRYIRPQKPQQLLFNWLTLFASFKQRDKGRNCLTSDTLCKAEHLLDLAIPCKASCIQANATLQAIPINLDIT